MRIDEDAAGGTDACCAWYKNASGRVMGAGVPSKRCEGHKGHKPGGGRLGLGKKFSFWGGCRWVDGSGLLPARFS